MKKIYFGIICAGLLISSCIDNVLDKKPLDLLTEQIVWDDESLIDRLLAQCYSGTPVLVNGCTTTIEGWGLHNYATNDNWDFNHHRSDKGSGFSYINQLSDECKNGWNWALIADDVKSNGISVNGGVLEYWEWAYKVIRDLNIFIENIGSAPVDEEFKTLRLAEARFLRAFNYFAMVQRYGGVPLITQSLSLDSPDEELYPSRNTEQELYDFIISEMEAIKEDLDKTIEKGRPNKYAALALKCRAALYAGSIAKYGTVQLDGLVGIPQNLSDDYYQIAYDAANEIIGSQKYFLFKKYDDKILNFKQLFLEKDNCEAIMVKPHDSKDGINSSGSSWAWNFAECPVPNGWGAGNKDAVYLEMAEEFERTNGTSGKLDRNSLASKQWDTNTLNELWADRDPRFYASIYTQGTSWKGNPVNFYGGGQNINGIYNTGFGIMKYLNEADPVAWVTESSTDYMIFRYAEILLNKAEAAFELDKTDEAWSAIKEIRDRAGIQTPFNSSDLTIDHIRHERKVELAFEGHRYWDVKRWRIAETELSRNFSGLFFDLDTRTSKLNISVLENVHGKVLQFPTSNYYFPITLARTGANSNLQENPGY